MKRAGICALFVLAACYPDGGEDQDAIVILALLQANTAALTRPCLPRALSTPTNTAGADNVISAPASSGVGNADSYCAINGVRGEGNLAGSLDVFSTSEGAAGAVIVLEWTTRKITNGTGIDFVVFENPFQIGGSASNVYLEGIVVEVSRDNVNFCGWAPSYLGGGSYSGNPVNWIRFAGITPVLYHQETNPLNAADLFDVSKAGGDGFDLGDANFGSGCSGADRTAIQTGGFYYVKMTAGTASGYPGPTGSTSGPDIDGVVARYVMARP